MSIIELERTKLFERVQVKVEALWLKHTLEDLRNDLSRIALPTAYFLSQALVERYFQQVTPPRELDTQKVRDHIQRTLVSRPLENQALLEELVRQAFTSFCGWFLEDTGELSEVQIVPAFQEWMQARPQRLDALFHLHAQNLARSILKALEPKLRKAVSATWDKLLGLGASRSDEGPSLPKLLEIVSAAHYYDVRDALAKGKFIRSEESPWPTAQLSRGESKGYAELKPAQLDGHQFLPPEEHKPLVDAMWKQLEELSDIDADVLDALSAIWLCQAKGPEQSALAGVHELLEMRGVQTKKNGDGRRGGYRPEQRMEMLRALSHIQNLWMNMTEMEVADGSRKRKMAVRSRAFTITDMMGQMRLDGHLDVQQFLFRPGQVFAQFLFGMGRQTALLSARALQYDPYRQTGEKRLTRYFSWQWRQGRSKGYSVETLLDTVGEEERSSRYAQRVRDRLEKLLDRLQGDQVIASWQYVDWDETRCAAKGWLAEWLQCEVRVEPPRQVIDHYRLLPKLRGGRPRKEVAPLHERVRLHREKHGLSFAQLGELLGIHRTALARIERQERKPTAEVVEKLEGWLSNMPGKTPISPNLELF